MPVSSRALSSTTRRAIRGIARAGLSIGLSLGVFAAVQLVVYELTQSAAWSVLASAASTVPMFWLTSALTLPSGIAANTWRIPRPRSLVLWGVTLAPVWLSGQTLAILIADTWPETTAAYQRQTEQHALAPESVTLLIALVAAPVGEELLMRGIVYRQLRRSLRMSTGTSAVISAGVFAALHGNLLQIGAVLLLGVFLALAYEATGNILVPIVLHGLFNLMSTFTPAEWVAPLASLPFMIVLWVATILAMILMTTFGRRL